MNDDEIKKKIINAILVHKYERGVIHNFGPGYWKMLDVLNKNTVEELAVLLKAEKEELDQCRI